ncbi:MAG TPA: CPBP family glutamic-type intramembrane protease [Nitrospira sp.]|nr:CPBP family glutamic-type intramembrane protease [Nitrospira sp.]
MTLPGCAVISLQASERGALLALLPIAATIDYYALPSWLQEQVLIQFAPQLIGYLALALWAAHNDSVPTRIGLERGLWNHGAKLGVVTGLLLGCLNSLVILLVLPWLGWDITFLTQTPHARVPVMVMVPWFIACIAIAVEINFRGFLLGRLAAIESGLWPQPALKHLSPAASLTSALVFAFDPFMVSTFKHVHWIALTDGLVWAVLWIRTRNLYATIVAHAIEVLIVYSAVRIVLMS